ncbi:MAG TPA: polyprenyl synthetase family protein [Clostridiaceae bacterium]|nr:polyprenyl synthetase family protein [Clostridiaceae bacterium]
MNRADFMVKYEEWLELVNKELDRLVVEKDTPEKDIYKAMRYSLMAGGKRLRPVLSLAVCDVFGGDMSDVIPFACAIEMIHTYSLIHDDLPSMDNDDYRRGRPTNHKVFGEGKAILAGDALLNYAFEIMLDNVLGSSKDSEFSSESYAKVLRKIKAMKIIANASGTSGMIGGQVVDLESEGKNIGADLLHYMHKNKTGALIKAPVLSSAVICGAEKDEYNNLEKYAENLGIAFQIKDDILDVEGSLETMGKNCHSDAAKMKSTFVTIYGLEKSKEMLNLVTGNAIKYIEEFGERGEFLKELALFLVNRNN